MIVRHEQALETTEMSDWFCGLRVHAAMITEAGVMNCRLSTGPAVVVTVAVPVGTVIALTVSPVVTVVVVVTVLQFQSTIWQRDRAGGIQTFCQSLVLYWSKFQCSSKYYRKEQSPPNTAEMTLKYHLDHRRGLSFRCH